MVKCHIQDELIFKKYNWSRDAVDGTKQTAIRGLGMNFNCEKEHTFCEWIHHAGWPQNNFLKMYSA